MSTMPVAGIVSITLQYLVGLKRLGYDVYYVEAHARTPSMFMTSEDDDSSALAGRRAVHFPQTPDGAYTGHHPADSTTAVRQLEELRRRGGQFFLLPTSAFWWLDHYTRLRDHLETAYSVAARHDDAGVIYALEPPGQAP
jgi:hypothetical protein